MRNFDSGRNLQRLGIPWNFGSFLSFFKHLHLLVVARLFRFLLQTLCTRLRDVTIFFFFLKTMSRLNKSTTTRCVWRLKKYNFSLLNVSKKTPKIERATDLHCSKVNSILTIASWETRKTQKYFLKFALYTHAARQTHKHSRARAVWEDE